MQHVFSNPFESPTPLLSPRGRSEKYRPRRGRRVTRDFSLLRYTPTSSSSQIKNYQCSFPLAAAARCRERERKIFHTSRHDCNGASFPRPPDIGRMAIRGMQGGRHPPSLPLRAIGMQVGHRSWITTGGRGRGRGMDDVR